MIIKFLSWTQYNTNAVRTKVLSQVEVQSSLHSFAFYFKAVYG